MGVRAEIQGVDAEVEWLINDEFTLAVNGGFIDAENSEFTHRLLHSRRLYRGRRHRC